MVIYHHGKFFNNCGFSNTSFTNDKYVVFFFFGEDGADLFDFVFSSYDFIFFVFYFFNFL